MGNVCRVFRPSSVHMAIVSPWSNADHLLCDSNFGRMAVVEAYTMGRFYSLSSHSTPGPIPLLFYGRNSNRMDRLPVQLQPNFTEILLGMMDVGNNLGKIGRGK